MVTTTTSPGERLLAMMPSDVTARRLESSEPAPVGDAPLHASLSELYLRLSREAMRERELLCVIALLAEGQTGRCELDGLYTLSGDHLRSRATAVPTGTVIGELALAPVSNRVQQIAVCLYVWPRLRRIGRIVDAVHSLTAAAAYVQTVKEVDALLTGVVDRLEVLTRDPDVSTVLGGVHRQIGGTHYALLGTPRRETRAGDAQPVEAAIFHVKGGRLCAGPSRDTASPWRGAEFALLSVGPARAATDASRIDQLRRQHTVVTVAAGTEEATTVTYQAKVDRLRLVNRLAAKYGARATQRTPATTPVTLTVALDVAREVMSDGEISADFASTVQMMRDGLKYELGCEFPSVRVAMSISDGNPGTYAISLEEVHTVSGTLKLDRLFCSKTPLQLRLLHFEGEQATNPANGNEGSWVARDKAAALEAAGVTIWQPGGYLVLHMSAVLRKNAANFATVQAVANLVRRNRKYGTVLTMPEKLPRFTRVIRGLLEDEIPVHEMEAICRRYVEVEEQPTYEILEEVRALPVMVRNLSWNTRDTPLYLLGKTFLELMQGGIKIDGEATVLALEPEPTQEMLSAVRNEVNNLPPSTRPPVVFCDDWRMRPFVRKLVELEFPHLRVLSRRECKDPDDRPVIGTIEVE